MALKSVLKMIGSAQMEKGASDGCCEFSYHTTWNDNRASADNTKTHVKGVSDVRIQFKRHSCFGTWGNSDIDVAWAFCCKWHKDID